MRVTQRCLERDMGSVGRGLLDKMEDFHKPRYISGWVKNISTLFQWSRRVQSRWEGGGGWKSIKIPLPAEVPQES